MVFGIKSHPSRGVLAHSKQKRPHHGEKMILYAQKISDLAALSGVRKNPKPAALN
jgi:hypothetical protein